MGLCLVADRGGDKSRCATGHRERCRCDQDSRLIGNSSSFLRIFSLKLSVEAQIRAVRYLCIHFPDHPSVVNQEEILLSLDPSASLLFCHPQPNPVSPLPANTFCGCSCHPSLCQVPQGRSRPPLLLKLVSRPTWRSRYLPARRPHCDRPSPSSFRPSLTHGRFPQFIPSFRSNSASNTHISTTRIFYMTRQYGHACTRLTFLTPSHSSTSPLWQFKSLIAFAYRRIPVGLVLVHPATHPPNSRAILALSLGPLERRPASRVHGLVLDSKAIFLINTSRLHSRDARAKPAYDAVHAQLIASPSRSMYPVIPETTLSTAH